jgi:hypothetical protein
MNERIKELAEQAFMVCLKGISEENWQQVERFAELVRQDEREAMGVKVRAAEFISAASKAPDATGRPTMWAEFPTRENT